MAIRPARALARGLLLLLFPAALAAQAKLREGALEDPRAARPTPSPRLVLRPTHYDLDLAVDFEQALVKGRARIAVSNPHPQPAAEASFTLYRLLTVRAARDAGGHDLPFEQRVVALEDDPKLQVDHVMVKLPQPLPPGGSVTLDLAYDGYLAGYVETGMAYVKDRVDSTFTILRMDAQAYPIPGYPSDSLTRALGLPTYDYVSRITVPSTHVVANGGRLIERTLAGDVATYVYQSIKPSWRMDFAIARYGTLERRGLRVFYLPGDSSGATRVLQSMQRTLGLYTTWFGPLAGDAGFTVVEIPDGWGSQADVTSIIQTAAVFRDSTRVGELYHEIGHLWNVESTDRPAPRWNEGLSTLLESLAAEALDGRGGTAARIERIAGTLRERGARDPRLARVAPVDYGREGMTGYAYSVGALAFYGIHQLAGPGAFRRAIGDYYGRYHVTGAGTRQLEESVRRASTVDLSAWLRDWFDTPGWYARVAKYPTFAEVLAAYRR